MKDVYALFSKVASESWRPVIANCRPRVSTHLGSAKGMTLLPLAHMLIIIVLGAAGFYLMQAFAR
jgi:hypothetical protein